MIWYVELKHEAVKCCSCVTCDAGWYRFPCLSPLSALGVSVYRRRRRVVCQLIFRLRAPGSTYRLQAPHSVFWWPFLPCTAIVSFSLLIQSTDSIISTVVSFVRFVLRRRALLYCVSKNDTDVVHYNFDTDQTILIIFGRDVAERVCCQMVICYPTSPN